MLSKNRGMNKKKFKKQFLKAFVHAVIMSIVISLFGTPVVYSDNNEKLKVQLKTGKIGNIFYSPSEASLDVVLENVENTIAEGVVNYEIVYADTSDGECVYSDSRKFSVGGKSRTVLRLDTGRLPYGVFELRLEISYGSENIKKNFEFSVINKPDKVNKKLGVNVHLGKPKFGYNAHDTMELVCNAGFSSIRSSVEWSDYEKEKGKYELLECHKRLIRKANENNLELLLILTGYNDLYDGTKAPYSDEAIKAFENYTYNLAKELRGRVKYFEVLNEYDLIDNESIGEETYKKILIAAYNGVNKANNYFKNLADGKYNSDDDAVIVGLGGMRLANSGTWIKNLFELEAAEYMDIASVHFYEYKHGGFGILDENFEEVFDVISKNTNKEIPLWVTETGWPDIDVFQKGTFVVELYTDEKEQAEKLLKTYVKNMFFGVDKLFFYDFENDGEDDNYEEHNFGMVNYEKDTEEIPFAAKASYAAISNLNAVISDWDKIEHKKISDGTQVFSFFENEDENCKVIWNDVIKTKYKINCEDEKIVTYDMYGNEKVLASDNGVVEIETSETPVFVRKVKTEAKIADYKEKTINVRVCGISEFKNKNVVCNVLKPGKSAENILENPVGTVAYFDVIKADTSGNFEFDFEADSYGLYEIKVTDGETSYIFNAEFYLKYDDDVILYFNGEPLKSFDDIKNGDTVSIKLSDMISDLPVEKITVICTATGKNEITACEIQNVSTKDIKSNSYSLGLKINNSQKTDSLKVYILESIASMRPLWNAKEFSR